MKTKRAIRKNGVISLIFGIPLFFFSFYWFGWKFGIIIILLSAYIQAEFKRKIGL